MDLIDFEKASAPNVILNPFEVEKIQQIHIFYMKISGCWVASVEFKNGNTKGEQRTPNCKTYEEVMIQMKQIIDSVTK